MLDPNEWTIAVGMAIVRRRDHYVQAEPMKLVGADGRFMRVHTRIINGSGEEHAMPAGEMERQAFALMTNLVEAAEGIAPTTPRTGPDSIAAVTYGADSREPTTIEAWSD